MNIPARFTQKQYAYLQRCLSSWFNVAEGGKRGGKNVLQTMAFCLCLENHPDKLHLVAGVSTATAKLNILDCDGFGAMNYFEGRCRLGVYQNRECLYASTMTGEKVILVSGGGKNGDEKLIKGNTYGMAYVTESNECSKLFIQEVFDRTLSSRNRKIFHDFNPKPEGHWYYSDILEPHEEKQDMNPDYGYNYGHFTIADNMSVSDEQLAQRIGTYDKNSIWYKRDILGLRKQAEGLVYAFDERKHTFDTAPPTGTFYISVDYGTINPFSAGLWCVAGAVAYRVREYYYDSKKHNGMQLTDEEYYQALEALAAGLPIKCVVVDPSAASFIACIKRRNKYQVRKANNSVLDGIRCTATYLKYGRIKIHKSCKDSMREFGIYAWDEKKSSEDAVIKENDHAMDDIRYFCMTIMRRILSKAGFGVDSESKTAGG